MADAIKEFSDELPPGSRVGRYEVVRTLGRGGGGTVYLARLPGPDGFDQRFALKIVRPVPGARAALLEEASVARGLRHGNVVQVLELGRDDELDFVVMELVDGPSLEALLRARPRPPAGTVLHVGREIARALHAVHTHAAGLVHRDVSPSNILLSRTGEVKLADFGIAKATAARGAAPETSSGTVKGKLGYLSPEQAAGTAVDARSDLFSLAVCLFEALTGENPLRGTSDAETYRRSLRPSVPPPSRLGVPVDAETDAFFARALAADPAQRFPSANALRTALEALPALRALDTPDLSVASLVAEAEAAPVRAPRSLAGAAAAVLGAGEVAPRTAALPVAPRRRAPRWAAALALAAAGTVGALVLTRGGQPVATPVERHATPAPAAIPPAPVVQPPAAPPVEGRTVRPVARGARLRVNVDPWAEVVLDGKVLGSVPREASVPAGRHTLVLRNPALRLEKAITVHLAPGETRVVSEWPR